MPETVKQQLPAGTNLGLERRSARQANRPIVGKLRDPSKRCFGKTEALALGPKERRTPKLTRKSPAVVKTILYNNLLVNNILPFVWSLVTTFR